MFVKKDACSELGAQHPHEVEFGTAGTESGGVKTI
jgi:hypothetical protein